MLRYKAYFLHHSSRFIEKYGTHVIVGVKMGGKDVIHIKQQQNSLLQPTDVQKVLKKLADERFSEDVNGSSITDTNESAKKRKVFFFFSKEIDYRLKENEKLQEDN